MTNEEPFPAVVEFMAISHSDSPVGGGLVLQEIGEGTHGRGGGGVEMGSGGRGTRSKECGGHECTCEICTTR